MCRKLELIYSSSFSHWIGSVLYLASTTNHRLWQLSESQSSASAQIPFTPGLLMHKISNLQPFSDWLSFRKRNTISFWETASCCIFNEVKRCIFDFCEFLDDVRFLENRNNIFQENSLKAFLRQSSRVFDFSNLSSDSRYLESRCLETD